MSRNATEMEPFSAVVARHRLDMILNIHSTVCAVRKLPRWHGEGCEGGSRQGGDGALLVDTHHGLVGWEGLSLVVQQG